MRSALLLFVFMWRNIRLSRAFVRPVLRNRRSAAFSQTQRMLSEVGGGVDDDHKDRLVARQKAATTTESKTSLQEHLKHQKHVFDEMSDFFATKQTIPDSLVPIYEHLTSQILSAPTTTTTTTTTTAHEKLVSSVEENSDEESSSSSNNSTKPPLRILDAACGSGALFSFLLAQRPEAEIVGVDLAPQMVAAAKNCADSSLPGSNIQVIESDIIEYAPKEKFDIVILNACFGNFWDPSAVLEHASRELLVSGGSLIVSHPLGAEFVAHLHTEDPVTVPHLLPADWDVLTRYLPLQCKHLENRFQDEPYYFACLQRVRHVALAETLRLRGTVASGFGRGGKKLGFPTANLSPADMRPALETIDTGVYFGWAVIEGRDDGDAPPMPYKAVVNVGFSPTFEGKENAEKIVEAHLILSEGQVVDDFYGKTMRLQLHGFLRPEIKFPSFPALIAQITADRDEAREALDVEPSVTLCRDGFLVDVQNEWVGSSGGDEEHSWEFQNTEDVIESLL